MNINRFGNFQILCEIGRGSYGIVYKVQRIEDGLIYALKQVKLGCLNSKDKENALNEIRILASIENLYIVGYKEAFISQDEQFLCIVMEYLSGGDLYNKIAEQIRGAPQYTENEIWKAIIQISLGLKALHDLNIVHRDLKSANIFISNTGTFKLGDMNVSKLAKEGLVYTQIGTPYYASPEIWRDEPYNYKSDIWSFGCIIYEMCCMQTPFRAQNIENLFTKVQAGIFNDIPTKFSQDLNNFIKELLQQNSKLRPSCNQILNKPIILHYMSIFNILPEQISKNNNSLLQTITISQNTKQLSNQLPKSQYQEVDDDTERMIIQQTQHTQRKSQQYRTPQKQIKTDGEQYSINRQSISNRIQTEHKLYSVQKKTKHCLLLYEPRISQQQSILINQKQIEILKSNLNCNQNIDNTPQSRNQNNQVKQNQLGQQLNIVKGQSNHQYKFKKAQSVDQQKFQQKEYLHQEYQNSQKIDTNVDLSKSNQKVIQKETIIQSNSKKKSEKALDVFPLQAKVSIAQKTKQQHYEPHMTKYDHFFPISQMISQDNNLFQYQIRKQSKQQQQINN